MFDYLVLAAIFGVPPLVGCALAFWRWGFFVVAGLSAVLVGLGLFFLLQSPPPGSDGLTRAILINLLFALSCALMAGWLVTTLIRVWRRRRPAGPAG